MTEITMMNPTCLKLIEAIFMVWLMLMLQVQVDLVGAEEVRCIERERQALLHFKAVLVDDFGILSSWGTDDCCQWKGVSCSNLTAHILMLDLHSDFADTVMSIHRFSLIQQNPLSGKIHTSLMELQQLTYLNLSGNNFEGSHIPKSWGSLSNLRYLDLSASNFGGKIPSQFGNLSQLKFLNLGSNNLKGSIPYQLGKLSKLQYVDLSNNYFEGTIPSQLGNLSSLQKLYLQQNYYESALKIEDGIHAGSQWLSNLTSLTHLDLSGLQNLNNSHNWLQEIGKLPKLRQLSLFHSSLSDQFILSLDPSKFNFSSSLAIFDLSYNTFMSSMIFQWISNFSSSLSELHLERNLLEGSIPIDFGTAMVSLELLYLHSNRLNGGIVKSLKNICTLRSLFLSNNNLIEDLPTILHNLSAGCVRNSLQVLDMSRNQITGSLPDISLFSSLKSLDLSRNQLSGKIPEGSKLPSQLESLSISLNSLEGGIPKSFGNICTLGSLDMSYNSLSEELPVIIHQLSGCARYSLQKLYLQGNQINGTLSDLSTFPFLKVLHLYENRLNGKIYADFHFPSQLENLDLSSNSLKGELTNSHFANMSMLRILDLSDNSLALTFSQNWVPSFQLDFIGFRSCKLGPTFPKWLQTQNNFTSIDISNAGISEIIPKWFWAKLLLQKVYFMNISYNNFIGVIPNLPLPQRYTYSCLILASNQFEGPIPPFLRGAMILDLSNNKFSDFLSFACANDTVNPLLVRLSISNNYLSGQIADCWIHFKSLVYLDLSHNNFSGKIPTSMGSLHELTALILRNNSLTKEIPFSLRSCTKLLMLDVGENRLSGPIPSWIGSRLQKLLMLSLRRNHFFGNLPLHLCHLTNLQLLDFSSNNLSGQIPKCIKNFTLMAQKISSGDFTNTELLASTGNRNVLFDSYNLIACMMWKGSEHMFKNSKLLKSIDLSSNQLSEDIPSEIADLLELVSLNLSRNNLTGEIPRKIGSLISLEFLDMSRNQLFGSIPSSLAHIDRLSVLDLSHNHLSGEIPTSTQLQSFNASSFEYNLDLCGRPLEKMCKKEEPLKESKIKFQEDEHLLFIHAFYISMAVGFVAGLWGIFGPILVIRPWRHAYFRFLNNLTDKIYVMIAVKIAKYNRWRKG